MELLENEVGQLFEIEDGKAFRVETEITIDAPVDAVWKVLTDFERLKEWSPNFIGLEGPFEKDGDITALFKVEAMGFSKVIRARHPLVHFEEGRKFGWSAPFGMGLSDNHVYEVRPLDDGTTRFYQSDEVHGGVMEHLLGHTVAKGMLDGYLAFNRALKARVEEA